MRKVWRCQVATDSATKGHQSRTSAAATGRQAMGMTAAARRPCNRRGRGEGMSTPVNEPNLEAPVGAFHQAAWAHDSEKQIDGNLIVTKISPE